jgi:hypothetical protein
MGRGGSPERGHRRRGLQLWRSTATALVTSWRWGRADDVQVDAARTGARSAASISSWSFEEGRQERLQATVRCRWGSTPRFATKQREWRISEGAPGLGEEYGPKGSGSISLWRPHRRKHGGSSSGLRRRIAAAWRRYSAREQRGKAEGGVGLFIAMGMHRLWQGVKGIEGGEIFGLVGFQWGVTVGEDDTDGWVPAVSVKIK